MMLMSLRNMPRNMKQFNANHHEEPLPAQPLSSTSSEERVSRLPSGHKPYMGQRQTWAEENLWSRQAAQFQPTHLLMAENQLHLQSLIAREKHCAVTWPNYAKVQGTLQSLLHLVTDLNTMSISKTMKISNLTTPEERGHRKNCPMYHFLVLV